MKTKQLKVKDIGRGSTELFYNRGFLLVDSIDDADIVVLNGGSDIATEIYKQNLVHQTFFDHDDNIRQSDGPSTLSARDRMEIIAYNRAKAQGKFIFAICRGAQLVNCLEGGTLWQHVNNHGYSHAMVDVYTKQIYRTTSIHHQMMRPPKDAQIIAVASESTYKVDMYEQKRLVVHGKFLDDGEDPEIVWFPKARALCIQGHPEYAPDSLFADYCFELTDKLRCDGVWPAEAAASMVAV